MFKRHRHSPEEVATKLSLADRLLRKGETQAKIANALGVSIMTFHRWRKARRNTAASKDYYTIAVGEEHAPTMVELRLENERLRRIVADLELDRARLQEQVAILSGRSFSPIPRRGAALRRRRRSPVHRRAAS
jgi:putative transposase